MSLAVMVNGSFLFLLFKTNVTIVNLHSGPGRTLDIFVPSLNVVTLLHDCLTPAPSCLLPQQRQADCDHQHSLASSELRPHTREQVAQAGGHCVSLQGGLRAGYGHSRMGRSRLHSACETQLWMAENQANFQHSLQCCCPVLRHKGAPHNQLLRSKGH